MSKQASMYVSAGLEQERERERENNSESKQGGDRRGEGEENI